MDYFRRVPQELDCPLDYWLVSATYPYFNRWRSYGITANMITIMGTIIQLIACLFFYYRVTSLAGPLWFIGYCFDTFDGAYARYHNMASDYGDRLDHFTDWLCMIIILTIYGSRYPLYPLDFVFIAVLMIAAYSSVLLQEEYLKQFRLHLTPSRTLSWLLLILSRFHLDIVKLLRRLRWFGAGHCTLALTVYIILLPYTRNMAEMTR